MTTARPYGPLVICSKSTWLPAVRREHRVSQSAAEHGHEVTFLERPMDVRTLRTPRRREYLRSLAARAGAVRVSPGITVRPRATLVPGHRGALAEAADARLLGRDLERLEGIADATVVATTPWEWSAVRRVAARRRVLDCADDWGAIIPGRRRRFARLLRGIGREADAVIVVSPRLAELFDVPVTMVPNGLDREVLDPEPAAPPEEARMVYLGTLTERFDAPLVAAMLELLPEWRLDLYGQSHYAGRGEAAGPELAALLARFPDRITWHGAVSRAEAHRVIDAARVAIAPHRRGIAHGDSMKMYDYAARGRPIVGTNWTPGPGATPPGLRLVEGAAAFAEAVRDAAGEPPAAAAAARAWAATQAWERRWPDWARATFGPGYAAGVVP